MTGSRLESPDSSHAVGGRARGPKNSGNVGKFRALHYNYLTSNAGLGAEPWEIMKPRKLERNRKSILPKMARTKYNPIHNHQNTKDHLGDITPQRDY